MAQAKCDVDEEHIMEIPAEHRSFWPSVRRHIKCAVSHARHRLVVPHRLQAEYYAPNSIHLRISLKNCIFIKVSNIDRFALTPNQVTLNKKSRLTLSFSTVFQTTIKSRHLYHGHQLSISQVSERLGKQVSGPSVCYGGYVRYSRGGLLSEFSFDCQEYFLFMRSRVERLRLYRLTRNSQRLSLPRLPCLPRKFELANEDLRS